MENISTKNEFKKEDISNDFIYGLKSLIYSIIGLIIFFIPIKSNGQVQTIIYHLSYKLQTDARPLLELCIVLYTTLGCLKSIFSYKDKKNSIKKMFLYIRLLSILILLNIFYGKNTIIFLDDNVLLLINEVILNVATVLPISAIFMPFILEYGLLDIVESYLQRTMKKMFKLSGKSIVNILVYLFVDTFSGFFMTNKLYKSGKLREVEACMIMLNFSIISFPMSIYISKELDINRFDFIIASIFIAIVMNIILCRIYPLNKKRKSYYIKTGYKETIHKDNKFQKGLDKHLINKNTKSIFLYMLNNAEESIKIVMELIPNIVIILYIGNAIINTDIIIEILKYIVNPLSQILKIPSINEFNEFCVNLFYNNVIAIDILNKNIEYTTRFLIGIVSLLTCTSLTSNIAYISSTEIKISKIEFIISYLERLFITMIFYSILHYFYIGYIT
ncbi:nucleoside recognition domain-containing protein [Faecalimicrobium sp. JNUCC 81]